MAWHCYRSSVFIYRFSMSDYVSWGVCRKQGILRKDYCWQEELAALLQQADTVLLSGNRRSYGDSCYITQGVNLSSLNYDRFVTFDRVSGRIRCDAGVLLSDLNDFTIPLGWFVPVTPGTQQVTVGGMIANDVHGKNHHRAGSLGNHIRDIDLLRTDIGAVHCSKSENSDLFAATIGGLGLTGAIMQCELQLKAIPSSQLYVENHVFSCFSEFQQLSDESDAAWEYTVAWLDGGSVHGDSINGIFSRGNHLQDRVVHLTRHKRNPLTVPFMAPNWLLNSFLMKPFNRLYFSRMQHKHELIQNFDSFFYPLDGLLNWNRLYGKRGFFQYQCVVPLQDGLAIVKELLTLAKRRKQSPYLSVLKRFGDIKSVGLLSFPEPGYTIAMDFPNKGAKTLAMLAEFDAIILQHRGKLYPAKDARMAAGTFAAMYPNLDTFKRHCDPKCSSDFWRRVTSG